MSHCSMRKLSIIILVLLLTFASVLSYSAFRLSKQFTEIEILWSAFRSQNNEKARLHNALYGALGYGGMIHGFKNYILRKDFDTFLKLERSMGAARGVVDQYLALGFSPAERLALNDIQEMLNDYQESLLLARKK